MNFDFGQYLSKIVQHQFLYTYQLLIEKKEDSCEICYPFTVTIPIPFRNFASWYKETFPVVNFTGKSLEYFNTLGNIYKEFNLPQHKNTIFKLIYSIRYQSSPGNIIDIIHLIAFTAVYSDFFEKNPLNLTDEELADREPIEDIFKQITLGTPYFPFASTLVHNPLSELPYFGVNLSTLNLTFNSSLPKPKPIAKPLVKTLAMATNDEILNYLKTNTTGSILLRIEPYLGDGTQDPYTWIESFEKAASANKWNAMRKREVLPAFLHGVADEWQQAFYGTQTTTGNPNWANLWTAITDDFKDTFCTQRWKNKWLKELDTIKQGSDEPIEAYYSRFNRLIKRSEITDGDRVLFYFKKGLRSDLLPI